MKILSKLFKTIEIITYIAMIITVITVSSDANVYEYLFYEIVIFSLFSYSKYIVDVELLKRKIKESDGKLADLIIDRKYRDKKHK